MVQLESVLSGLASNVAEFRNIPSLPGEIWTRILSFSECPERCNAELVSHKLKEAAEANWSLQRRLEIDLRANTHNKVLALLKRCGQQLEEISTRQHLPQPYGGEPLGQLCPNLKGLAFCGGSGFCLTDCPTQLTSENYRGDLDRLFTSFSLLERLEFYSTFVLLWSAANVVITTSGWCWCWLFFLDMSIITVVSELIRGLVNVTSLRELHLFEMESQSDWSNISKLQQLRVLSVRVRQFATALNCICPQEPREPLNLQQFLITIDQIGSFTIGEAVRMGKSLTNLESLVIISAGRNLQISLVPTIVREFHSLKTFVLTTTVPPDELPIVNLSPFRDRHPAINVFIDSRIRHLFTGESDNVKLISLRNEEPGEALQFLQNCNLNGFNFQTQFCLKMMSRSFKSNGVWDFFHIPNDQRHEINIEELDLYNFASEYESEDDYEHENDWEKNGVDERSLNIIHIYLNFLLLCTMILTEFLWLQQWIERRKWRRYWLEMLDHTHV